MSFEYRNDYTNIHIIKKADGNYYLKTREGTVMLNRPMAERLSAAFRAGEK